MMELYVRLNASLDMTSVCVLDGIGKIVWRGRCSSTPDTIARVIREPTVEVRTVGPSGPCRMERLPTRRMPRSE